VSSSSRRFNRTLFTMPVVEGHGRDLIVLLEGEDIELVLDAAMTSPNVELASLCAEAAIYYVHEPELPLAGADAPDTQRLLARAAHLALRHRTCLVADEDRRRALADAVASVVGMRVLDIAESPATIVLPP